MQPDAPPPGRGPSQGGRWLLAWFLIVSGVLLGIGVVMENFLDLDLVWFQIPIRVGYGAVFEIIAAGEFVTAVGFLLAFVALALLFRTPTPGLGPFLRSNALRVILAGGLMVALGLGVPAVDTWAALFAPAPSNYLEVSAAGSVVEALGFVVVFTGFALVSLRRPASPVAPAPTGPA